MSDQFFMTASVYILYICETRVGYPADESYPTDKFAIAKL